MEEFIQVFTTVNKKSNAEKIAESLVHKKLSACVQIVGPVSSFYKWKGRLEKSKEFLCVIKTKKSYYKKIEKEIKKLHPYKLPEIIFIPTIGGNKEYLKWIGEQLDYGKR